MPEVQLPVSLPLDLISMAYSLEQKWFIVKTYIETKSETVTVRKFLTSFGRRTSRQYVHGLVNKLKTKGTINNIPRAKKSLVKDEDFLAEIKNRLAARTSLRKVAREIGFSLTTVQKASKNITRLHPYRLRILKELKSEDKPLRVNFANWFLDNSGRLFDASLFFFSDESNFYLDGTVNAKNCVYWACEPPEDHFAETTLNIQKIGVWAAMSSAFIIGPYFFTGNMNGDVYRQFLDRFHTELDNLFGDEVQNCWFQQDGASSHTARESRTKCSEHFGGNVVGKLFEHQWPPRSPDLSLLDFFLWGVLKEKVFSEPKATTLTDLKNKITAAFDEMKIETAMLNRAWECLLYRCQLVINKNGAHIEKTVKKRQLMNNS